MQKSIRDWMSGRCLLSVALLGLQSLAMLLAMLLAMSSAMAQAWP